MIPQNTNDLPLPLKPAQQTALTEISGKLKLLAFVSPEALSRISAAVDGELQALEAAAPPVAPETEKIAALSAGRFGGKASVDMQRVVALKAAADRRLVAGIDREKVVLLKVMHGDDPSLIADAWRNQQAILAKPRRGARQ